MQRRSKGQGVTADEQGDDAFRRPDGLTGGFPPRPELPSYPPPPPTVSPAEQAVFGRPAGAEAFAPAPGERINPQHRPPQPVPRIMSEAFGAPPGAVEGFDPAPGTRLNPAKPGPGSPWWKADALRDPWRDPSAAYWLGRGALFSKGQFEQRDPAVDEETLLEDVILDEDDAAEAAAAQPRRPTLRLLVFLALGALLIGAVGGGVGWWLADKGGQALHRNDVSFPQVDKPANRPPGSVADIAQRVGPAVVRILVQTDSGSGVGSGVVIDKHGYVLTNNHVVAHATSLVVEFSNEARADARVVGRDPVSDLAVIQVPDNKLTVAALGSSAKLAVGDPVIAIGSPLGYAGSVTAGIVSAKDRPVCVQNEDGSADACLDAIQTDAAINPGNSGGALVDAAGAVVGINSAAALGTSGGVPITGIGWAIPIDYARRIATELISSGKAAHAALGVQGYSVISGLRAGAYLSQIEPNGPAAKAGLKRGDVVVAVDGQPVQIYEALVVFVQQHKPGDKVSIAYFRGSAQHTLTVTLAAA